MLLNDCRFIYIFFYSIFGLLHNNGERFYYAETHLRSWTRTSNSLSGQRDMAVSNELEMNEDNSFEFVEIIYVWSIDSALHFFPLSPAQFTDTRTGRWQSSTLKSADKCRKKKEILMNRRDIHKQDMFTLKMISTNLQWANWLQYPLSNLNWWTTQFLFASFGSACFLWCINNI